MTIRLRLPSVPGMTSDGINQGGTGHASIERVWSDVLCGRLRVFAPPTAHEVSLLPEPARAKPLRAPRESDCLTSILRGQMQKVVAVERGRSQATISGLLKRQLKRMGVEQSTRRLPLALALLAHATDSELVEIAVSGSSEAEGDGASWRLIAELSEVSLTDLTPSERDVTRRYLEGQTHAQIASERASRPRTVANQLSVVFQRYGATGRFDLLRAILERGRCLGARSTLHLHRGDDQCSPTAAHAA